MKDLIKMYNVLENSGVCSEVLEIIDNHLLGEFVEQVTDWFQET